MGTIIIIPFILVSTFIVLAIIASAIRKNNSEGLINKTLEMRNEMISALKEQDIKETDNQPKNSELKSLTCNKCGAPIDEKTKKCPYCGTQYR